MQPVFLGDVQGCGAEMAELLARADARFGPAWELWQVGDLINRGPSNLALLREVRERVERGRCRYVLGNHEISLLRSAWGLRTPHPLDTFADVLDDPEADDWIDWLRRRPVAESGTLGARPFVMVHAAVAPGWSLEETLRRARGIEARLGADDEEVARALLAAEREDDPTADDLARLTRCRRVRSRGRWSSRDPETPNDAWHHAWSGAEPDYGVVYGHWAVQGLHVAPRLRGLDSACVHHDGRRATYLTAWIPALDRVDPFALPDPNFWQVPAQRRYYGPDGPIPEGEAAA